MRIVGKTSEDTALARAIDHSCGADDTILSPTPLSSSGWVYQRCPEYLTGKRAHPRDLICTGVHLVGVVWDNLHIMSHLHPGSQERHARTQAQCPAPATSEAGGLFADAAATTSVCCANPRSS